MGFPTGLEASVERYQCLVPTVGGREGGGKQGTAQAASTAGDVSLPLVLSTVVIERSQAGKRCGFLAADLPKFGHADQKCQRGALSNAWNAQHQIEPSSEVAVGTKALGKVAHLRGPPCLQSGDVAVDDAPQAMLVDVLDPSFEARDVFLELFKKGQISRQFRQSWIWRNPRLVDSSGACGNQLGIERIVLGASQMHSTERLDLDRLQHQHDEARCSQMLHHTAFVTARCFDSDTRHASIGQVCDQSAPARQGVRDLPALGATVNGGV